MKEDLLPEIKNGFSFSCQKCGRCCQGYGEGFVFLYDKELLKIAKRLKISVQECVTKYVDVINTEYKIRNRKLQPTKKKIFLKSLVLKQDSKDGSCIFLNPKTHLCQIYGARPFQCRSWPMWHPLMTDKTELREAQEKCSGFQSKDGFISRSQILNSLEAELKIEYTFVKTMRKNGNDIRKTFKFLKNTQFTDNIAV
ncbi:MAG: YkgJ family cysteine cluster protein [Candidatus Lokiarchaeota archaeon]|nr:YkgJ family cysteine cluster protein [Candidatus Lokiarchaeota archaeon]